MQYHTQHSSTQQHTVAHSTAQHSTSQRVVPHRAQLAALLDDLLLLVPGAPREEHVRAHVDVVGVPENRLLKKHGNSV